MTSSEIAEPASEHDPERAEQYAESVPVDPTPDEIDHYTELTGEADETAESAGGALGGGEAGR
jgi:hypothetical protein